MEDPAVYYMVLKSANLKNIVLVITRTLKQEIEMIGSWTGLSKHVQDDVKVIPYNKYPYY